jgi:carbon-monoxide dehydrogenase large subunit
MRRVNSLIGSPIERVEDLRFLRGRGQYVDDLVRPDTWHAEIVRSSVAHGRLRGIDASVALKMPGVHAVLIAACRLSRIAAPGKVLTRLAAADIFQLIDPQH